MSRPHLLSPPRQLVLYKKVVRRRTKESERIQLVMFYLNQPYLVGIYVYYYNKVWQVVSFVVYLYYSSRTPSQHRNITFGKSGLGRRSLIWTLASTSCLLCISTGCRRQQSLLLVRMSWSFSQQLDRPISPTSRRRVELRTEKVDMMQPCRGSSSVCKQCVSTTKKSWWV